MGNTPDQNKLREELSKLLKFETIPLSIVKFHCAQCGFEFLEARDKSNDVCIRPMEFTGDGSVIVQTWPDPVYFLPLRNIIEAL